VCSQASLALQIRVTLLLAAEAAANAPASPYPVFRAGLDRRVGELEAGLDQLRDFIADLAGRPIKRVADRRSGQFPREIAWTRRHLVAEQQRRPSVTLEGTSPRRR
jgi:hypothetical protein